MRTYLNTRGKYVSIEPDVYCLGKDLIGRDILTNSMIYRPFENYGSPFHKLTKYYSFYQIKNCIVISDSEYDNFLKYLYNKRYTEDKRSKSQYRTLKVGDTAKFLNYTCRIADVSYKLYLKIDNKTEKYPSYSSIKYLEYIPIFSLTKIDTIKDIRRRKIKKIKKITE